jgi:hypothetical protein
VTEPSVVEKIPEQVSVTSTPVGVGGMSILDVTGLVGMVGGMLSAMEGRILDRMRENSDAAKDRWALHDAQLTRDRESVIGRFLTVEGRIEDVNTAVTLHHQQAHDAAVATDARLKPIRTISGWLWANRKDLLLTVLFVLAVLGFMGDTLAGLLGNHA